MRMNGREVRGAQVLVKLRDWMGSQTNDLSYPQAAGVMIEIPLWTQDECAKFFEARVAAHESAETNLPECTGSERWQKETTFAVMKEGQKNALSGGVYKDRAAAEARVTESPKHYLQIRPGKSIRCQMYCPVSNFCRQYAAIKAEFAGIPDLAAQLVVPERLATTPSVVTPARRKTAATKRTPGARKTRPESFDAVIQITKGKR